MSIEAITITKRFGQFTALDKVELTKFMRTSLAGYKVPTIIEFADSLPKSNIGKILRKDLH